MVAVENHSLTEYVNRPFVFRRVDTPGPEVFHAMIVLAIEFVEIRHKLMSLRDGVCPSWQSPDFECIKDKSAKT